LYCENTVKTFSVETNSVELTVWVFVISTLVFVLFAIMEDPDAVENDRFWLFIVFDSELNTWIVDPDAVEKFRLLTFI
jgi:hypothetical protein